MAIFEDTIVEGNVFAFPGDSHTSFAGAIHSWSNKEVLHWIDGIDSAVAQYRDVLEKSQIDGKALLLLDEDGIYDLGVSNFGVAKMIFQAIQLLLDFCYNVGEENLQTLCLNVCISIGHLESDMKFIQQSLRPEPSQSELVSLNNILFYSVCQVVEHLKKVLVWLDKSPFDRVPSFISFRSSVMQDCLSLLRAVCDPYLNKHLSETVTCISEISKNVYEKCDSIITTSFDPMVCYTTFFDDAVLKKTKDFPAWGFNLQSSYRGVHIICEVKLLSPADACGKVDAGDEILQINGEIILGWELGKVANRLSSFAHNECCRELNLLVNKRPREPTVVPRLPRPGLKLGSTTLHSFKRKCVFFHSVITEESDVMVDENGKQKCKQDSSGLHPDSRMTASSASTDFLTGESPFDHEIRLMRRVTISCGTPPLLISSSQQQNSMERSQSLTIPLMVMVVDGDKTDELNTSAARDFKMAEETGMQVEMVIRRRRTMRQQPGGYVRSFIDNQPICEVRNREDVSKDDDADSVCTSVFIDKGSGHLDDSESEKEPDHYAVIDVVDQCDLDLLNLLPVDNPEWSSSLHLPLCDEVTDGVGTFERQESTKTCDDISVRSYAELAPSRGEDSLRCSGALNVQMKYQPSLSSSLRSNMQAPIAETDETSLGWDSEGDSDGNYQQCTTVASPNLAGTNEATGISSATTSNMLKELSYTPCGELLKKQLEGWVRRKRLEHECSSNKWIKCWMVLHEGVLYVYQNREALRADIVIAVAKFIVSDAPELKTSKKYVFRLCRNHSAFYFAAYKFSEMKEWMNKLGLAAICYNQTAEEREKSDTLSRSMVFVASLDENTHLSPFSCTPSPPVHHTLPRASVGNAATRRMERIHRQNSLRNPRCSPYTADSAVSPTTFFSSKFFKRNESMDN